MPTATEDIKVEVPKRKLSLEDLRVESFLTTPIVTGSSTACGYSILTCGLSCTSNSCDGGGPTCFNCQTVTRCC
jgi:hypothetical protein